MCSRVLKNWKPASFISITLWLTAIKYFHFQLSSSEKQRRATPGVFWVLPKPSHALLHPEDSPWGLTLLLSCAFPRHFQPLLWTSQHVTNVGRGFSALPESWVLISHLYCSACNAWDRRRSTQASSPIFFCITYSFQPGFPLDTDWAAIITNFSWLVGLEVIFKGHNLSAMSRGIFNYVFTA